MKSYVPLAVGLIDEGRFVAQANADLMDMQSRLLKFVKTHGDQAKGAKAKLTLEITLAVDDPKDEMFSIKAQTKMAMPARPASMTMAIGDQDDDGSGRLFVRQSGSDASTPRQGKFCTDDGELVHSAIDGDEAVDA